MQVGERTLVTVTLLPDETANEVLIELDSLGLKAELAEEQATPGGWNFWVTAPNQLAVGEFDVWHNSLPNRADAEQLGFQRAVRLELLEKLVKAAPTAAIEHRADRKTPDGWLYTLINEDRTALGEQAWEMVIGELERRDREASGS